MKRYIVLLFAVSMILAVGLCALGAEQFYTRYTDKYLILLPDSKSNGDLANGTGGTVYTDSSLTTKASITSIAGTGRYISVSGKKYEIIVIGDSDGDGLVIGPDANAAKTVFKKASVSEKEMHILDVDGNGKLSSWDYISLKLHVAGVKKIASEYLPPVVSEPSSEESSIDPDWANQCEISLADGGTKINGSGAVVSGKVVSITAGGEYTISGKLSDGFINVNSTEKVKLRLSNANISNSTGPAIVFANADKAYITINNGTVNYLSDGKSYSNGKATVYSDVDLEIKGKGTLYITANFKHAIGCDDDLTIENGNIIIQSSVKDGIHAKKSVEITGGDITVKNCLGDAIDCEGTSSLTKGTVIMSGGTLNISSTAGDGINALGEVTLNGGNVSIDCTGDCVKSDSFVYVSGTASVSLKSGSDGMNSKKGVKISAGILNVSAVEYTLKSDVDIDISGGTLTLEGKKEKIYALGKINITGGTFK